MDKTQRNSLLRGLLGALAVGGVLFALLIVTSLIFLPKDNSPEAGEIEPKANGFKGEPQDTIDVLFIGDSEVLNSFRPRELYEDYGFTSYDCSSPGQKLPYAKKLVHRALRNQSPKVAVIETHMLYLKFSFGDAFKSEVDSVLPIFEFHNRWKALHTYDLYAKPTATWVDEDKGFRSVDGILPADLTDYMAPTDSEEAITPLAEFYLRDIVNYCKAHDVIPVIASVPSPVNWNMERHNYMVRFAAEEGIDYIDFNLEPTKVDIDWQTETRDGGDHLNLNGSNKFSNYVGKLFVEKYGLEDHRGDPAYAAWDNRNKVY